MKHDELCPSAYTFGVCECDLIRRVMQREESKYEIELDRKRMEWYNNGFREGERHGRRF
jgi:hypothetical protein